MKSLRLIFTLFFAAFFSFSNAQSCLIANATDSFGNQNPLINCSYPLLNSDNCLNLTVDYPKIFATNQYSVTSETYIPALPYTQGTPLNANFDDVFPTKVELPFKFCFFGNVYDQVVIGSNGLITFDLSQLGKVSYPNIQANNPDPLLPKNSVFGVLQDIVFSRNDDSEIYYSVIGTAPCRKFVVSFYKGRIAGCATVNSTSQIVLHEGTNIIDVFVENKPSPCSTAKFPNTLIGILDETGNSGYSPITRNTGIWTATNEAWRFSPSGAEIIPQFQWLNAENEIIGNTRTIQVCLQQNSNFQVKVQYPTCDEQTLELSDEIAVAFAPDFPLAKNFTHYFCTASENQQNVNLNDYILNLTPQNPDNLRFSFHQSNSDAESGANNLPLNQIVTSNSVFYVRIQNPSDVDCFRVAKLEFKFLSDALISNSILICDQNADGVENNFTLSFFNSSILNPEFGGNVVYFLSENDAQNNTNPVTQANISASTQLWIRLIINGCSEVLGPIFIKFNAGPIINTPIEFEITTCDFQQDDTEPFDFQELNPLISTNLNYIFKYYRTYQQAYQGTGRSLGTIREDEYSIFVRVENPGNGCFSIGEIKLKVVFEEVIVENKRIYICFDGTADYTANLDNLSQGMLIDPLTGITKTYFKSYNDAVAENFLELQISPIQIITQNGNLVSTTFWIRFENENGCYTVRQLTIILVFPVPAVNKVDVCDKNNDGTETVNLTIFNKQIIGNQNATVTYFYNEANAQNNSNPITNPITITVPITLFIRLESYGCVEIYPILFALTPVPIINSEITISNNNVCDNNADGTENFDLTTLQSQIFSGSEVVVFNYFTEYNPATETLSNQIIDPKNFPASEFSTVFAQVLFSQGGCFSVSTIKISNDFLPVIKLRQDAILKKCDYDFNLFESFNLNEAISQMFIQSENTLSLSDLAVTYYFTKANAESGFPANQINSTQITEDSEFIVWARFQSKIAGCFSVAPILLKTYLPPKAIASTIVVCDQNLDSKPEVNFLDYVSLMVDIPNPEFVFSFYLTQNNAENKINPIPNPENFSANPFPAQVWVRIEVIPGCYDVAPIHLILGTKVNVQNPGPFSINDVCDVGNNGIENVNLAQFEPQISSNATFEYYASLLDLNENRNKIQNPENYEFNKANGSTIFVKVMLKDFCPELIKININLKPTPIFSISDQYFCAYKNGSVNIQPDFSETNIVSFEWKNPSGEIVSTNNELLNVRITGRYTLSVVAGNGCTFSTNFEVKTFEVPIITELIPNGNSYTVIATGSKTILYSIDGITWQLSNIFHNLQAGIITFYVKFQDEDCFGEPKQGLILNVKNAFTPNFDGYNDTWIIDDLHVFEGKPVKVQVFDEYGAKVFEQESNTKIEWDGFLKGRKLGTATYWYVLTLPDGRLFKGWILLKNRN